VQEVFKDNPKTVPEDSHHVFAGRMFVSEFLFCVIEFTLCSLAFRSVVVCLRCHNSRFLQ